MRLLKLANGITVVINHVPDYPCAYVDFRVMAGSRHEKPGEHGIAHFCEHMMFRGTKKTPYVKLRDDLYTMGDAANAYTSIDELSVYAKFLPEDTLAGVELLSNMIFDSDVDQDSFNKEKEVILQEYQMIDDQHFETLQEYFLEHSYPDSPLTHPVRGDLKQLKKATRADLKRYWRREIRPDKTFVALTGDFKKTSLKKALATLSAIPSSNSASAEGYKTLFSALPVKHITDSSSQQMYFILAKELSKPQAMTFHQSACMGIIDAILGGSPHSRLFVMIRDELGLTYDVGSARIMYQGVDSMTVSGSCTTEVGNELIFHTHRVWSDLCRNGITQQELDQTKKFKLVNYAFMSEKPSYITLLAVEQLIEWGKIIPFKKLCDTVSSITRDEINAVLRDEFAQSKLSLLTLSPSTKLLKKQFRKPLIL